MIYALSDGDLASVTADWPEQLEQLWAAHARLFSGLPAEPRRRRGYELKSEQRLPRIPIALSPEPSTDFEWWSRKPGVAQSPVLRIPRECLSLFPHQTLASRFMSCVVLLARMRHYAPDSLVYPTPATAEPPADVLPLLSRWIVLVRALPECPPESLEERLRGEWLEMATALYPHLSRMERR